MIGILKRCFKRKARREIDNLLSRNCVLLADEIIAIEGLDKEYPEVVTEAAQLRAYLQ